MLEQQQRYIQMVILELLVLLQRLVDLMSELVQQQKSLVMVMQISQVLSLLVVVSILVFNRPVLLLRTTLVSIHLTLLDQVTQLLTSLQQTLLMLVSQDQVEVEEVSQRHQQMFQAQVPQARVVLQKHLNDLHQSLLRLHKVQTIKLVDIWSYMTARLLQQLKNQQSQPDQCLEHLKVLSMVMMLNSESR